MCDGCPCIAISSVNSCLETRFNFTEHQTSYRGGGVDADTYVVSCRQFETHVISVSSLGELLGVKYTA